MSSLYVFTILSAFILLPYQVSLSIQKTEPKESEWELNSGCLEIPIANRNHKFQLNIESEKLERILITDKKIEEKANHLVKDIKSLCEKNSKICIEKYFENSQSSKAQKSVFKLDYCSEATFVYACISDNNQSENKKNLNNLKTRILDFDAQLKDILDDQKSKNNKQILKLRNDKILENQLKNKNFKNPLFIYKQYSTNALEMTLRMIAFLFNTQAIEKAFVLNKSEIENYLLQSSTLTDSASLMKEDLKKIFELKQNTQDGRMLKSSDDQVVNLCVVLGGDGSIMYANSLLISINAKVPILSFNLGTLGYLSYYDSAKFESILKELYDPYIPIYYEKRSLLEGKIIKKNIYSNNNNIINNSNNSNQNSYENEKLEGKIFRALNEFSFEKLKKNMLEFEMYYNGLQLPNIRGNGLIAATPTGSTTYNLSLKGPIIHYNIEGFIINFDAAFTFNAAPIFFSKNDVLKIFITGRTQECNFITDGIIELILNQEYGVEIKLSNEKRDFIILHSYVNNESDIWMKKIIHQLGWGSAFKNITLTENKNIEIIDNENGIQNDINNSNNYDGIKDEVNKLNNLSSVARIRIKPEFSQNEICQKINDINLSDNKIKNDIDYYATEEYKECTSITPETCKHQNKCNAKCVYVECRVNNNKSSLFPLCLPKLFDETELLNHCNSENPLKSFDLKYHIYKIPCSNSHAIASDDKTVQANESSNSLLEIFFILLIIAFMLLLLISFYYKNYLIKNNEQPFEVPNLCPSFLFPRKNQYVNF